MSVNKPESATVGTSEQPTAIKTIENRRADSPGFDASDDDDHNSDTGDDASDDDDGYEFDPEPSNKKPQRTQSGRRSRARPGPPHPNGRFVGRQLVMWHRPRMIEKLILHVQYECQRAGLHIPWGNVVHRLTPGSSGAAAIQHLNRLRDVLIGEGHMVPPLLGKMGAIQDPNIRGYIRDMDGDSPMKTRPVDWDEKIEDRKESLAVPGIIRGSGNYRRRMRIQNDTNAKSAGQEPFNPQSTNIKHAESGSHSRRSKSLQEECRIAKEHKVTGPLHKVKHVKKGKAGTSATRVQDVDPAELDSDDDYDPKATNKTKNTLLKLKRKTIKVENDTDVKADRPSSEDKVNNETWPSEKGDYPITPVRLDANDEGLMTPPETSGPVVKLSLDPRKLALFPGGVLGGSSERLFQTPGQHSAGLKHSFSGDSEDEFLDNSPSIPRSRKIAKLRHDRAGQYINGSTDASNLASGARIMPFEEYMPKSEANSTIYEEPQTPPPKMGLLVRQDQAQTNGHHDQDGRANDTMVQPLIYDQMFQSMSTGSQSHTSPSSAVTDQYDPATLGILLQQNSMNSLNIAARQTALSRAYSLHGFRGHEAGLATNDREYTGTPKAMNLAPSRGGVRRHSTSLSHGLPNSLYQMPLHRSDGLPDPPNPTHGDPWPSSSSYHPTTLNQTWKDLDDIVNSGHGGNAQVGHPDRSNEIGCTMTGGKAAHPDNMPSRIGLSRSASWMPSRQSNFADSDDLLVHLSRNHSFPPCTSLGAANNDNITPPRFSSYGPGFY